MPESTTIELSKLIEHDANVRSNFDQASLQELAASIKANGLLSPLLVHGGQDGTYQLIAGHRRLRAMLLLVEAGDMKRNDKVPITVHSTSTSATDATVLMLVENCQREDISPIDEAKGYRRLLEEHGVKQKDLVERVGKSSSHITKRCALLGLVEEVQAMVGSTVTLDQAYEISQLDDDIAKTLIKDVIKVGGMTPRLQFDLQRYTSMTTRRRTSAKFTAAVAKAMIETTKDQPLPFRDHEKIGHYDLSNLKEYEPKRGHVVVMYGADPTSITVYRKLTAKQKAAREEARTEEIEAEKAVRDAHDIWSDNAYDLESAYNEACEMFDDQLATVFSTYLTELAPRDAGKIALAMVAGRAINAASMSCERLGINVPNEDENGNPLQSWKRPYKEALAEWIGNDTARAVVAWIAGYVSDNELIELDVFTALRDTVAEQGFVRPVEPDYGFEPIYDSATETWITEPPPYEDNERHEEAEDAAEEAA